MNKSRRMANLQARALAHAGYDVLQIDLLGCGDSAGDFADASWQNWRENVLSGYRWLRARSLAPLTLWGLRAGCLLAVDAAVDLPEKANFLFWQPVSSGKQHWQQFMRLKVAGELASGHNKGVGEQLRLQIAKGHSVEIAGYVVSQGLVEGLEKSDLTPRQEAGGRVGWLELSIRGDATLAPISQKWIEQWQAAGFVVSSSIVLGPTFWKTTEIADAPELIKATLALLESWQ